MGVPEAPKNLECPQVEAERVLRKVTAGAAVTDGNPCAVLRGTLRPTRVFTHRSNRARASVQIGTLPAGLGLRSLPASATAHRST